MINKKILVPLLIFFLLFSVVALGTPNFVDIGTTTEFKGDAGVPADSAWYIGEYRLDLRVVTEWTFTHLEDQLFFGEFAKIEYVRYSNFEATSAPTVNDDTDLGYIVGSLWYDVTADKGYACLDNTNGAAVWIETTSLGHTNLTSFVDQTAWRVFYSNTDGDVVELALGTAGKYLKSTGATSAPEFDTPAGTTTFTGLTDTPANYTGEAGKYAKVNSGENALEFGTPAGTTVFTGLTDTPANYTGEGGKYVKVNVGENALEFGTVAGEANTASNIGGEIEIFKQKTGVDLEFRTLKAESSKITVSNATDAVLKISNELNSSDDYIFAGQHAGQYWLAGSTYTLGIISVYMKRYNDGSTIKMQVYEADVNGHPTGGELGNVEIDCTQIGTGLAWLDWDLTSEDISITNTTKYCWYLTGDTAGHGVIIRYKTSDEIANSWRLWYATGSWNENTGQDDTFKLYSAAVPLNYIKLDVDEVEMNVLNLLSTTTVAFNADADTVLYTVPTGKRCVLSHAIVVAAGDAGGTTTVSIGQNTAETDFVPANTLSNLDAEYDSVILMPIPNTTPLKIKSYAADTVIEAQVASQSGVAGNTIYLFGILY